jgi:leucyl aminopeptidase (aminopeptidase T)
MMEDEGAYGTCHIGIGDNTSFDGTVKAASHIDLIMRKPTIKIDGKIIQKDGELTVDHLER